MTGICYFYGQQHYPVPYQTSRGLGYLMLAFALSYGGFYVEIGTASLDFILKNSGALLFLAVVFFGERNFFKSLLVKKS